MSLYPFFMILLQSILVLLAAPLTVGLIRFFKARYQNRRGAHPLQPYFALYALFQKEMTVPEHSSWVFRFVPYAVLTATMAFALLVPTLGIGWWSASLTNVFFIAALLALGSVFLVMGGMDTGSTFGNMGSSREMTLASLAEPAFFIILATLSLMAGSGSLDQILAFFGQTSWGSTELLAFPTLAALLLILLGENARYPVDNPATHLELTMVHEAMLLEYSGPYLAMLEYASSLRLLAMGLLYMNILIPFGVVTPGAGAFSWLASIVMYGLKLVGFSFLIASIESLIVKMRFYRMQEYFLLAFLLALSGGMVAIVGVSLR